MSTRNSLDRESFEMFLANALAVQKSGLDQESLFAVVEIQQFIATKNLDLDQAMQKISDCLLQLFHASGVAIALLDASGFVYRAGAGSAAKNVGRHLVAVLNTSSSGDVRPEILRVENAETDRRIEAEICRQFGARSLLILPICENHSLLGILQVLYDDAHAFTDGEIRVFRLMIGALEEGMLRSLQRAKKPQLMTCIEETPDDQGHSCRSTESEEDKVNAPEIPAPVVEVNAFQGQAPTNQGPATVQERRRIYEGELARDVNRLRTSLLKTIRALLDRTSSNSRRVRLALTAALVLGTATWLLNINHLPTSAKGPSVAMQPDTGRTALANPLLVKDEPNILGDAPPESAKSGPGFRRVVISPNEVDYIADDVTIRRFTISFPKPKLRNGIKEVNFGDDVTVRYFAKDAAGLSRSPSSPEPIPTTDHPVSPPR